MAAITETQSTLVLALCLKRKHELAAGLKKAVVENEIEQVIKSLKLDLFIKMKVCCCAFYIHLQ